MMQRYAEYKDSGVDWLGEIPAEWETAPIRSLFTESRKKNRKLEDSNYLSLVAGVGVIPYAEKGDVGNKMPEDLSNCKIVAPNDFVLNSMNFGIGSFGRSKYQGVCSSVYVILKGLDITQLSYFERVFQQPLFQKFSQSLGNGILAHRCAIGWDELKNERFPVPSSNEVNAIAEFLDGKVAKIEALVGIKRRQIEVLAERKQILIQNAVTKGLNPAARMKDSGVDWIGKIPAHWEVKSLNFIAHLKSGDTISAERFKQDGYPVFGGNGFRGYTDKYTNEGNYVLIGRQGALCGNVNYASGKFFASEHAIVVYPQLPIATRWLGELIRKANFNRLSQSAAQPGISVEVVSKVRFPYAPIEEQREIANFIDHKAQKIDAAITIKQNQITKLNEYKTTLINAAVTGKIKVV